MRGPRSSRETDEFFRDRQYGELWAGRRPSLHEISTSLGIEVRHIDDLPARWRHGKTRVHRGIDRRSTSWSSRRTLDADFARVLSELRLIKDEWEVGELQEACDITTLGFEDCVREWDRVLEFGERWIEGTFFRRARAMGNDIGYDSIVGWRQARHHAALDREHRPDHPRRAACCSTWASRAATSTPPTSPARSRSTAPSPRCSASSTTWSTPPSRPASRPSAPAYRSWPRMTPRWRCSPTVSTTWACCRSPPTEALDPDSKVYARWTLHGTSHMLGMDVHDCGRAATEIYPKGTLAEGMVLTVEPGLYFQEDDLLVPEELRGIGIRIEDDILVTADGYRNLSAALPRDLRGCRGVDGLAQPRRLSSKRVETKGLT